MEINNILRLHSFISVEKLEDMLFDIFEGSLDMVNRKVILEIEGEKNGRLFYTNILKSHWILYFTKEGYIDYFISSNSIMVYPKVILNINKYLHETR